MSPIQAKRKSHLPVLIALGSIACVIVVVIVLAISHMQERKHIRNLRNPVPATTAALVDGAQLYQQHCQNCHGAKGDGKGQRAAELSTAPSDFTEPSHWRNVTDGEIYWQITKGQQPMPAFEDKLNEEQRWETVNFI